MTTHKANLIVLHFEITLKNLYLRTQKNKPLSMKKLFTKIILLVLLVVPFAVNAQNKICLTQTLFNEEAAKDPSLLQNRVMLERHRGNRCARVAVAHQPDEARHRADRRVAARQRAHFRPGVEVFALDRDLHLSPRSRAERMPLRRRRAMRRQA